MPPSGSLPRLERILVMVPWVISHPDGATVQEVCARFGITEQELLADIELLFVCGLPPFSPADLIDAQVEGGKVVISMADYLARPLRLTRWEAVALYAMGRAIAGLPGVQEAEWLDSALKKLGAAIAPGEASAAADLAKRVEIELTAPALGVLGELRGAIAERRRVRIVYYSAGRDAVGKRELDPWLVFGALRQWYVTGFDHSSNEERVFRVDRIQSIEPTGQTFERPGGFDPTRYGSLYTPSERDERVVLDLAPQAAWVPEVTPHDSVTKGAGGRLRMELRTGHLAWLERLILQLGDLVTVIEPPELADGARRLAERALARY